MPRQDLLHVAHQVHNGHDLRGTWIRRQKRPDQAEKSRRALREIIQVDGCPGQIFRSHFVVEQMSMETQGPHQVPQFVTERRHEFRVGFRDGRSLGGVFIPAAGRIQFPALLDSV